MPSDNSPPTPPSNLFSFSALISMFIMVPCVAAVLAAYGLAPQRADTVGIDLGTTYSVVAYKHPTTKKIIMVPAYDHSTSSSSLSSSTSASASTSHLLTPSIVSYGNDYSSAKEAVHVGREALPFLHTRPKNTIYNAKRLIGRTFKDVSEDVSLSTMPHDFGPVDNAGDTSTAAEASESSSMAGFVLSHGITVSPVDVAANVIRTLINSVDHFLGHSNARKAVIAVPAQFNTAQREATAAAFIKVGIKVINMLEEPTAAAIAYGLQNEPHIHNVLVYDFGGGTLDVSLLWMATGSVQVTGTDGDSNLGGSDFDKCMVELLAATLDRCEISKTRKIAEEIKRKLSTEQSTIAACGDDIHLSSLQKMTVTRSLFEQQCDPLFQRALIPVQRLLDDHNMLRDEIDEVVLVGGSTRIPKIREMLTKYFNGHAPKSDIDPDLAVAYGAAMFSA